MALARSSRRHLPWLGLSVAAALLATGAQAQAQERAGDWVQQRQARFAQWRTANAGVEQRIAALKSATAALVQQHRQTRDADREAARAALAAKAQALSPADRQRAQDLTASGMAEAKAGNCAAATATFQQSLAINPVQARALNGIGECLRTQGRLVEASTYLTRTVTLPPIDADTEAAQLNAMVGLQKLPPPPGDLVDAPPCCSAFPMRRRKSGTGPRRR
jgi:tetratricopeptide (TPR) repeat protein